MKKTAVFIIIFIALVKLSKAQQGLPNHDPLYVFNEFWQVMKENYAFFELRGVNWDNQKKIFQPKINEEIDNDSLFRVMLEMIAPLQDGHTFIIYKDKKYRSTGVLPIWNGAKPTLELIRNNYLLSYIETANGHIAYGWMKSNLGYIRITAMEGYAPELIDEAIDYLSNAKDLIVDVRFNGGGEDNVSLFIASRFADKKRWVYSKKTYFDGSTKDHLDLYIAPPPHYKTFTGNIFLLTNRATFSAAEMFVMAMVSLPNCISIGDNTAGAHSDVLQITLSNGWTIGLSNQIYTMPDGLVYEKTGIPPRIKVINESGSGHDLALEKAILLSKDLVTTRE